MTLYLKGDAEQFYLKLCYFLDLVKFKAVVLFRLWSFLEHITSYNVVLNVIIFININIAEFFKISQKMSHRLVF